MALQDLHLLSLMYLQGKAAKYIKVIRHLTLCNLYYISPWLSPAAPEEIRFLPIDSDLSLD